MSRVSTRSQVITSATAQSEVSWPKRWKANSEFYSPANLVASGYTKNATKPLLFFEQSVGGISWHPVSDHKKFLSVTLITANQPTPRNVPPCFNKVLLRETNGEKVSPFINFTRGLGKTRSCIDQRGCYNLNEPLPTSNNPQVYPALP